MNDQSKRSPIPSARNSHRKPSQKAPVLSNPNKRAFALSNLEFKQTIAVSLAALLALIVHPAFAAEESKAELRDATLHTQPRLPGLDQAPTQAEIRALVEKARDGDELARLNAVCRLGEIGPAAHEAVPVLIERLKDMKAHQGGGVEIGTLLALSVPSGRAEREYSIASCAALALGKIKAMPEQAVPALVELIATNEFYLMRAAYTALIAYLPDSKLGIPNLLALLQTHKKSDVSAYAAVILGALGAHANAAQGALIQALDDKRLKVRSAAALALADIGPLPESAIPALIRNLEDKEFFSNIRPTAQALSHFTNAEIALPALTRTLTAEKSKRIREGAAQVFLLMGPRARQTTPELVKALNDGENDVQEMALEALGAIGPDAAAALPTLKNLLSHKQNRLRMATLKALAKIHQDVGACIPDYVNALADKEEDVRLTASSWLRLVPKPLQPGVVKGIEKWLADESFEYDDLAIQTLGEYGPASSSALPSIVAALKNGGHAERSAAAEALVKIDTEGTYAIEAYMRALGDSRLSIRRQAIVSLGSYGTKARKALPHLREIKEAKLLAPRNDAILNIDGLASR